MLNRPSLSAQQTLFFLPLFVLLEQYRGKIWYQSWFIIVVCPLGWQYTKLIALNWLFLAKCLREIHLILSYYSNFFEINLNIKTCLGKKHSLSSDYI